MFQVPEFVRPKVSLGLLIVTRRESRAAVNGDILDGITLVAAKI